MHYEFNELQLLKVVGSSGHKVWSAECNANKHVKPVFFKENKYHEVQYSQLEIAFAEVAELFLPPHQTPKHALVKKEGKVVGIAIEALSQTIARREPNTPSFYSWEKGKLKLEEPVKSARDIPYYFLNEMPSGFFSQLMKESQKYSVDIQSLASMLVSAYTLEEDDLHKGNIGFYMVPKDGKVHVVFMKIDHDLLLTDSLMSRFDMRFLNGLNKGDAFTVTAHDLVNFPLLTDSSNYYWPTRWRFPRPFAYSKMFHSAAERQAFADLRQSEEFKQYKWRLFYQQILISPQIIAANLQKHCDPEDAEERARIALVVRAVVSRQAQLRAVLFSIPEFRDSVAKMTDADKMLVLDGLLAKLDDPELLNAERTALNARMTLVQAQCASPDFFQPGDTPLHIALKLNEYRYSETWDNFHTFAQVKNAQGETPLDLSCLTENPENVPVRRHLFQRANRPTEVKGSSLFKISGYEDKASKVNNYQELKTLLRDIGEDYRFGLKTQKVLAVKCVKAIMQHPNAPDMLKQLKRALKHSSKTDPQLQYLSQLRSQLWIIRLIRGIFGNTSTISELNELISQGLKKQPCPSSHQFFNTKTPESQKEPAKKNAPSPGSS